MIVGIGVDVVDVPRFSAELARVSALRERLFAPSERDLPLRSLAGRFAAKEALAKALGSPGGLSWQDAVVAPTHGQPPQFALGGTVAARCHELGVTTVHLSISHDGEVATAMVIAEARPNQPTITPTTPIPGI